MEKIPSAQLLEHIVTAFRDHLSRYSAFTNNSLCYYGVEVEIPEFIITTYSRAEVELKISPVTVTLGGAVGELTPTPIKIAPLSKRGGVKPSNSGKYGTIQSITGTAPATESRG